MTKTQLPPFAISTERYEQFIAEAINVRSMHQCSTQRWHRTERYAKVVGKRTGRTVTQVIEDLS